MRAPAASSASAQRESPASADPDAAPSSSSSSQRTTHLSWRAFVDFRNVRENADRVSQNVVERKVAGVDVRGVVSLYDEYVRLKEEADTARMGRNENTKKMKSLQQRARAKPKVGQDDDGDDEEGGRGKDWESDIAALVEEGKRLKEKIALLEEKVELVETSLQLEGQRLPNDTHPDVPRGPDAAPTIRRVSNGGLSAEVVEGLVTEHYRGGEGGGDEWTRQRVRNHVDVALAHNLVDFDSAATVSGNKFYYLKNALAILELALVNWAMQRVAFRYGFQPMITPDLVRGNVLEKCGFQPRGTNTQVYGVEVRTTFPPNRIRPRPHHRAYSYH